MYVYPYRVENRTNGWVGLDGELLELVRIR